MSQGSQTGLADTMKAFERVPFHPKLEVPLEGVVTLSMLSIYEYAQRGNIDNMLQRANQALALAMSMALHEAVEEEQYADSKRRIWWMTVGLCDTLTVRSLLMLNQYMMACQASAISGTVRINTCSALDT